MSQNIPTGRYLVQYDCTHHRTLPNYADPPGRCPDCGAPMDTATGQ